MANNDAGSRANWVCLVYVAFFPFAGAALSADGSGDDLPRYVLVGLWWVVPLWLYLRAEKTPPVAVAVIVAYVVTSLASLNSIVKANDEQGEGFGFAFTPIFLALGLIVVSGVTLFVRWLVGRSASKHA